MCNSLPNRWYDGLEERKARAKADLAELREREGREARKLAAHLSKRAARMYRRIEGVAT